MYCIGLIEYKSTVWLHPDNLPDLGQANQFTKSRLQTEGEGVESVCVWGGRGWGSGARGVGCRIQIRGRGGGIAGISGDVIIKTDQKID